MTSNANSVNMKNTSAQRRPSYHHGDLRSALIEAGLALLDERTIDALSLREVARAVGVSATAVYRHFPDKQALLMALCREGAERLGAAQQSAMDAAGGGQAGFDAAGQTYVRFALAQPALFRLMMTTTAVGGFDGGQASSAMRLLRETVADLAGSDASADQARLHAAHAWSLVHGMAMLMLDGQLPQDERLIASITSESPMLNDDQ